MRFLSSTTAMPLLIASTSDAFHSSSHQKRHSCTTYSSHRRLASSTALADTEQRRQQQQQPEVDALGLTPELKRVTEAFAAIGDEQVRYKQLLYMAQNTKEANNFPESSKIPENKVPGCLSTVYVDGTAQYNKDIDNYVINFVGDSDGLLTKGLVALLVRYVSFILFCCCLFEIK